MDNKAYGNPTRGARRRREPTILACLHQTANAKATAIQERNYANRAGSWGPSATASIDRDGTINDRRRGRVGREHERVGLAGDTGQVTRPITSNLRASWARRVAMLAERFGTTNE